MGSRRHASRTLASATNSVRTQMAVVVRLIRTEGQEDYRFEVVELAATALALRNLVSASGSAFEGRPGKRLAAAMVEAVTAYKAANQVVNAACLSRGWDPAALQADYTPPAQSGWL